MGESCGDESYYIFTFVHPVHIVQDLPYGRAPHISLAGTFKHTTAVTV